MTRVNPHLDTERSNICEGLGIVLSFCMGFALGVLFTFLVAY